MKQHQKNTVAPNNENNPDDSSFVKLHSTLFFLLTRFHRDHSPQLAQYIVSHINLIIEHPDAADFSDCRELYLGLLQQWQYTTADLLEQMRNLIAKSENIH